MMYNLKTNIFKVLLRFFIILTVLIVFYFIFITRNSTKSTEKTDYTIGFSSSNNNNKRRREYNVWLVFTKVTFKSPLRHTFYNLLVNILNISTVPLKFHIIVDNSSKELAINKISDVVSQSNKPIHYKLYDVEVCAKAIEDIVNVMTPHFSSKPGTYYSDALFYISLGLYRIAPKTQTKAILLDCDLYFKQDIALLFKEFDKFKPNALFGLAPELSPIYRHILHLYKAKHNTTFGDYYYHQKTNLSTKILTQHPNGFQGYNSGVVLINLSAIRNSKEYSNLIKNETLELITNKYNFRGHLGDQDFYTLIGYEYPQLIQTINCGFNRQLCTWWRDHGYSDIFHYYFKCRHPIVVLHGNCRTRIPKD